MSIRPLTQEDLRWLVCPVCYQDLHLQPEIPSIQCVACARIYFVVDNLPILLPSRTTFERR